MGYIRWGGKKFYPQKPKPYKPDINELMKPLSEKVGKGNIWGSQIMNVEKDGGTPLPPVSPTPTPSSVTPTPTASITPTITPTSTLTPTPTSSLTPTPSITPSPSPAAFDSDAALYLADVLSAGGTLDATISAATDTLFTSLKSNGLYSKLDVFWPMLGATSGSTALMGKRVSGTTYDLTYSGGFTYSSSGATGNGVDGWANTNFNSNDTLQDDYSLGFYQFTENTPVQLDEVIMGQSIGGVSPALQIATNISPTKYFIRSGSATAAQTDNSGNIDGFYVLNRTGSTTSELYRNGNLTPVLSLSTTYTAGGTPTPIALWNFYQTTTVYDFSFANQGLCFAFIGRGLSGTDITNFSNIINTFQTTLGRNTY